MGADRLSYWELPMRERAEKALETGPRDVAVPDPRMVGENPPRLRDRLIKVINSALME